MQPSGKRQPVVFLDRDGVLIQSLVREGKPYSPRKIEDLVILEGVREAVSLLHRNGFVTVVVTNQPDVARGNLSPDLLSEIHNSIYEEVGVEHFYTCKHDDHDDCECRKPNIGLFKKAVQELDLDASNSFMVGDRWKDIEAGQRAGCTCFFIDNDYSEKRPTPPFYTVTSLLEAAKIIVEGSNAK